MSKGRFALLMLLVGSTATSGCVAAAVPVLAAGAIGKKQFFGKKDEDLPSATPPSVTAAGAFVAGEFAGLCSVTAFEVEGPLAGLCSATALVVVAGPVAGLVAGCVIFSGSCGNGARVSDGNAFATDGISTLGEFVVTGPGVRSFFASARVSVDFSGVFGNLFNASAVSGIGLGSIEGGVVSVFATSFDGVTGVEATFCGCWSQPTS